MNLTVLYPQPKDTAQFDSDYAAHLRLLHEKMGLPPDARPYSVTKFLPGPEGPPPYYQMFRMPFETAEGLEAALASEGMQEVAADAHRISSGGAPTILIGKESA